ncbi:MAG: hypothetical protein AB1705_24655 [Verrucomicrobiota bacterium]
MKAVLVTLRKAWKRAVAVFLPSRRDEPQPRNIEQRPGRRSPTGKHRKTIVFFEMP